LAALLACTPERTEPPTADNSCEAQTAIQLVNHGWHTGIVVRAADLVAVLPTLAGDFGAARYLEVGWGDQDYYQAEGGTTLLALRAMFTRTPSVLHLVAFDAPAARHFPASEVMEVPLQQKGYRELLDYLAASFARSGDGSPLRLGPALYGRGWFYRAVGEFHAFNTCNTWVAKALRQAGLPISSRGIVGARGLLSRVRAATAELPHCPGGEQIPPSSALAE
jgi:uncharacterized protein (TIGR02117 family)